MDTSQKSEKDVLYTKENEQLFKIAFRNYINLIAIADRKAALLIQVNAILGPVVYGFVFRKIEANQFYFIPTAVILLCSIVTIFFGILASKPLDRKSSYINIGPKEQFFFGSFDRLEPNFDKVSWEKYFTDMQYFFKGEKEQIFYEMIKESFQVRKVLYKKFGYLTIAYKVFFVGLLSGIIGYLIVIILESY